MEKMTVAEIEKVCKKELSNKFGNFLFYTTFDDMFEIFNNINDSMIDIIPNENGFLVMYFEDNEQENANDKQLETIEQVLELCTKLFEK